MSASVPETGQRERMENIWLRFLYMILYFIVHRLATMVLYLVAALQFLMVLFSKDSNEKLIDFSWSLNQYILQTGRFLSFETEQKPFPFVNWPARNQEPEVDDAIQAETSGSAGTSKEDSE